MKKMLAALTLAALLAGCGNDLESCGETYTTKGLITLNEQEPHVKYRAIPGNVVLGVALSWLFLAPTVYFIGFSMYEPVSADCAQKGKS